jgi:hypothetical protein
MSYNEEFSAKTHDCGLHFFQATRCPLGWGVFVFGLFHSSDYLSKSALSRTVPGRFLLTMRKSEGVVSKSPLNRVILLMRKRFAA